MRWRFGDSNFSRLREIFDRSSIDDDFVEIVNGGRNFDDIHSTECANICVGRTVFAVNGDEIVDYNRLIPRYNHALEYFLNILFPKNLNCISCKKPISKSNSYSLCKDCYEKVGLLKYTCSKCSKPIVRSVVNKDDGESRIEGTKENIRKGTRGCIREGFKEGIRSGKHIINNQKSRDICEVFDSNKRGIKTKDARERLLSRFSNKNRQNRSSYMNDGCDFCRERNFTFDKNISCFSYNEVSTSFILPLKYSRKTFLAEITSRIMIEKLKFEDEIGNINLNEIDYIMAVPLSDKRIKKRGFNQSEILAREISHHFVIPYFSGIKRTKNTKRLFSLNMDDRKKELEGAFSVDEKAYLIDLDEKSCLFYLNDFNVNETKKMQRHTINILKNSNVLLVDDIFTTGSTLNEISKELKKVQVAQIYTMTVLIKN